MATSSISKLSSSERIVIVSAIDLKHASVARAMRAEVNPAVRKIREDELALLDMLRVKISNGSLDLE